VTRTRTKVSILMMRPNRKGKRGARMAKTAKNAKNRDHGRLLQKCEKTGRVEDGLGTHSYDSRDRLAVPRSQKRDRKI